MFRMADWLVSEWEKVGAKLEKVPLGPETLHDGTTLDLPPALLGAIGDDPNKKTVELFDLPHSHDSVSFTILCRFSSMVRNIRKIQLLCNIITNI